MSGLPFGEAKQPASPLARTLAPYSHRCATSKNGPSHEDAGRCNFAEIRLAKARPNHN